MNTDNITPEIPNVWTVNPPQSYPGRIKDEQGKALTGFVVKDGKKERRVSVLSNGNYMRHYRFPKDLEVPTHPMIRWLNLPMSGIPMLDENGNSLSDRDAVIKTVFEGKKPVGDIMYWNEEIEKRVLMEDEAKKLGLELFEYELADYIGFRYSILFGVNKPLGDLFDLKAISQFYHDGTNWSWARPYFYQYLMQIQDLTPVQALQTYEWNNPQDARELVLTGLCLGYALESTLSIMLEEFNQ